MYIYEKTGNKVFTVGYYKPRGKFVTETVHSEKHEAVERVHYLNGGVNPELFSETTNHLYALVANINFLVEDLNQRLDRIAKPSHSSKPKALRWAGLLNTSFPNLRRRLTSSSEGAGVDPYLSPIFGQYFLINRSYIFFAHSQPIFHNS